MKITRIVVSLLLFVSLAACDQPKEEIAYTLELIGEDIVMIEEGLEYVDLGVLLNGEKEDVSYVSSVNTKKVGTYYVKFEYLDKEILRTVVVTPGAKTELKEIIKDFSEASNYSYSKRVDVQFTNEAASQHRFDYEDYDVYGNYFHGSRKYTAHSGNEYFESSYIIYNETSSLIQRYRYDQYGFWYEDRSLHHAPTTSVTDFILENLKAVTRVGDDYEYVYTGFLNFADYMHAYRTTMNLMPDDNFQLEVENYLEITIKVQNGFIVEIVADLTDIMNTGIDTRAKTEVTEYVFQYTFSHYYEVAEIVVPQEGLSAERIVNPRYSGSGTVMDPYVIMDDTDFISIDNNLSAHYKLGADIDLDGWAWMPFGLYDDASCFTGSLDGSGFAINNMSANGSFNLVNYGLFQCVVGDNQGGGIIKNLTFNNVAIYQHNSEHSYSFGVVTSDILFGEISNVTINGTVTLILSSNDINHYIHLGGISARISNQTLLTDNTINLVLTVRSNLPAGNVVVHDIAAIGQAYLDGYTSTSTIIIESLN